MDWEDTWGPEALPVDPWSRDLGSQSLSPRFSTSRGIPECERAAEQRGGGLHSTAQEGNALHPSLQLTAGDPSQIKQQLEIPEPLIHAAGAELARGCWALPAALRSCRLPLPTEPSPSPRFDPPRCPQPRRGHRIRRTAPRPPHPAAPPGAEHPRPPPGSPRCRQPPLRLTSAGHGRARRRGRGSGARSGAEPPAPSEGSACPG